MEHENDNIRTHRQKFEDGEEVQEPASTPRETEEIACPIVDRNDFFIGNPADSPPLVEEGSLTEEEGTVYSFEELQRIAENNDPDPGHELIGGDGASVSNTAILSHIKKVQEAAKAEENSADSDEDTLSRDNSLNKRFQQPKPSENETGKWQAAPITSGPRNTAVRKRIPSNHKSLRPGKNTKPDFNFISDKWKKQQKKDSLDMTLLFMAYIMPSITVAIAAAYLLLF